MVEANTSGGAEAKDASHEGRDSQFMDEDRMVNEGLAGGQVSPQNGKIGETTTDTMNKPESALKGDE